MAKLGMMTPGFAKPRAELPWLPYGECNRVIINAHNFALGLKTDLVWYWDLTSAGATITDQHSGLSLTRVGTTTTDATGGPDGGPCISVGAAAGKYRNASVAKTISYDDGYTVNIWARSTATSATYNGLIFHRDASVPLYMQMEVRSGGFDEAITWGNASSLRFPRVTQAALNTWQMLTLRDTGTTTELYRNGILVATDSTSLGARSTSAAAFAIGGHSWEPGINTTLNHRGQLAKAGVWNVTLTTAQIAGLYNAGAGLNYSSLT